MREREPEGGRDDGGRYRGAENLPAALRLGPGSHRLPLLAGTAPRAGSRSGGPLRSCPGGGWCFSACPHRVVLPVVSGDMVAGRVCRPPWSASSRLEDALWLGVVARCAAVRAEAGGAEHVAHQVDGPDDVLQHGDAPTGCISDVAWR